MCEMDNIINVCNVVMCENNNNMYNNETNM